MTEQFDKQIIEQVDANDNQVNANDNQVVGQVDANDNQVIEQVDANDNQVVDNGTMTCKYCNNSFPISSFGTDTYTKADGTLKVYIRKKCITCLTSYRKEHYNKNKDKYSIAYKKWYDNTYPKELRKPKGRPLGSKNKIIKPKEPKEPKKRKNYYVPTGNPRGRPVGTKNKPHICIECSKK